MYIINNCKIKYKTKQLCQLTDPSLFLSPNFFCAKMARITFLMSLLMAYHALMPIMKLYTFKDTKSALVVTLNSVSLQPQCGSAVSILFLFPQMSLSHALALFPVVSLIVLFSHCSSLLGPVINALTRMGGSFSCWLG